MLEIKYLQKIEMNQESGVVLKTYRVSLTIYGRAMAFTDGLLFIFGKSYMVYFRAIRTVAWKRKRVIYNCNFPKVKHTTYFYFWRKTYTLLSDMVYFREITVIYFYCFYLIFTASGLTTPSTLGVVIFGRSGV